MKHIDREQRIEELKLATVDLFKSAKTPSAKSYDEGATVYMQISWVPSSTADSTLDSRCVCTVRFKREQIDRYATMETAARLRVQRSLRFIVRDRFEAQGGITSDDCSVEFAPGDDLLDVLDGTPMPLH